MGDYSRAEHPERLWSVVHIVGEFLILLDKVTFGFAPDVIIVASALKNVTQCIQVLDCIYIYKLQR